MRTHYDFIPAHLLTGSVLDVGCGDGSNQRMSTNYPLLQACDYTGIDTTLGTDVFSYEPHRTFNTVLAIHIIEHIPQERWPELFERLKAWTAHTLVIGTPYRQSPTVYAGYKGPANQRHVVFGIDEDMICCYLSPVDVIHYQGPYSPSLMCIWRKKT